MSEERIRVEELDVLQTDIDDESPQVLGNLLERLLELGALDASLTSLYMKKNRPGVRVEVLCQPDDRDRFVERLLRETSTLGVRAWRVTRYSLPRRMDKIIVDGEPIAIKIATLDGVVLRAVPEYDDCKLVSKRTGRTLRDVMDEARATCQALVGLEGR